MSEIKAMMDAVRRDEEALQVRVQAAAARAEPRAEPTGGK